MFMVNQTKEGSGFWASNKSFVDGLFKAGAIIVGLKLLKVVLDKFDQWLFMHMIPIIHPHYSVHYHLKHRSKTCTSIIKVLQSTGRTAGLSNRSCFGSVSFPRFRGSAALSQATETHLLSEKFRMCHSCRRSRIQNLEVLLLFIDLVPVWYFLEIRR